MAATVVVVMVVMTAVIVKRWWWSGVPTATGNDGDWVGKAILSGWDGGSCLVNMIRGGREVGRGRVNNGRCRMMDEIKGRRTNERKKIFLAYYININTHTHTHTYIYIYINTYACTMFMYICNKRMYACL
jgi:hypothetical protein